MKIHPQIISQNGNPAFVVLPYREYERIIELLEDIADIKAVEAAERDKSERFPLEIVERIAAGENPIKILREYRQMSQTELAQRVNVSKQYISQIENGERTGTTKLFKAIAKELNVNIDDLII